MKHAFFVVYEKIKENIFPRNVLFLSFSTSDSGNILNQLQRILDLIQAGNIFLPDCNIK